MPSCLISRMCFAALLLWLGGCANLQTVHHRSNFQSVGRNPEQVRTISVDGNQRFLVAAYGREDGKKNAEKIWRTCAEPSPDGLAVFGGALAAEIANDKVGAQFAASLAAQAASIGLRTQSITLLRDAQYRLCEAYINGAVDGRQLAALHRRFQNIMVANLAIEQLTGYAKPTITHVGASGSGSVAGGLRAAQQALEQAREDLAKDEADAASLKTKLDEATAAQNAKKAATAAARAALPATAAPARQAANDQKKKADALRTKANASETAALIAEQEGAPNATSLRNTANSDMASADKAAASAAALKEKADQLNKPADDAQKDEDAAKVVLDAATKAKKDADTAVADGKENIEALEEARDNARGIETTASTGTATAVSAPAPSTAASKRVAEAVENIVSKVLDQSYTDDTCMDYLSDKGAPKVSPYMAAICMARMIASNNPIKDRSQALQEALSSPPVQQLLQDASKLQTQEVISRQAGRIEQLQKDNADKDKELEQLKKRD
ncbi:hypothetical protein ACFJIW_08045 [Tahibacter sp. UC22_41]|uniref:hypothetical protein n=1 Tax=Tahibacter sp. UC22_41 TaxID=3350178 RepID=UPI0036D79F30